ncbi:hypothetical protein [Halomarina oriensis]|uniref:Cardiolipin synthase N-terminal domain-containing protein n=1 Tax=Halomarina oriensis TaxID=671145 RepID=A0A6B0GIJ2_9EURY|nr:hypothetical protein [Halomarina oriensis]MWG34696.1 hypothetical protein [Halomarina oriensis]
MVPLQADIGAIFLVVILVYLAIAAAGTYWVYNDATKRNADNVGVWTGVTFVAFLLGGFIIGGGAMVLYYFVGRPDTTTSPQHGSVEEDWN